MDSVLHTKTIKTETMLVFGIEIQIMVSSELKILQIHSLSQHLIPLRLKA